MMNRPMYNAEKPGFIKRTIINAAGMKKSTMRIYVQYFHLLNFLSPWMQYPVLRTIYRAMVFYSPAKKRYSFGTVLPLNVDISDDQKPCVVPVDLIKKMLNEVNYISSTYFCICREGKNCKNYPKDVCCLMFGDLGKTAVKNGVAYEISKETALERLDLAAESGLIPQALWVEVEQYLWGVQDMSRFFEICFCDPCCCVAMNNARYGAPDVKERFGGSGWQAIVDNDKCTGCGKCVDSCPQRVITLTNGKIGINKEYCFGCGLCKEQCSLKAIKISLVKPMKQNILDYFREDGKLDLHVD